MREDDMRRKERKFKELSRLNGGSLWELLTLVGTFLLRRATVAVTNLVYFCSSFPRKCGAVWFPKQPHVKVETGMFSQGL